MKKLEESEKSSVTIFVQLPNVRRKSALKMRRHQCQLQLSQREIRRCRKMALKASHLALRHLKHLQNSEHLEYLQHLEHPVEPYCCHRRVDAMTTHTHFKHDHDNDHNLNTTQDHQNVERHTDCDDNRT